MLAWGNVVGYPADMVEDASGRFEVAFPVPAYLDVAVRRTLADRVAAALEELSCCRACPRNCAVNRLVGETSVCRTGRLARVSSAFAHMGEEACLRGTRGSGTIFFSMCNLRCVFCQNWDISQQVNGSELDAQALADVMLALQEQGCHNINFVTPEHVVPQVVEALALAIDQGLQLPIVYNTSAYDALSSLKRLDGLVDVYMPDFKFWSTKSARQLCKARDYPEHARQAVREMHRQVGDLCFAPEGVACRGVLVRHLVMPGLMEESRQIFHWLAREISPDTFVNIMAQYRPDYQVGLMVNPGPRSGTPKYVDINRRPTSAELEEAYEAARQAGLWRFDP